MNRRVGGVLILLLAAVGAVILSGLTTRLIAGTPIPMSVPEPPGVGDCLLEQLDLGTGSADGVLSIPGARIGSCALGNFGEVIAVKPHFPKLRWDSSEMMNPKVVALMGCPDGLAYLGLPGIDSNGLLAGWSPAIYVRVGLVSPDVRQQAAGQDWVACVAVGFDNAAGIPHRYPGRLRNAFADRSLPPTLGACARRSGLEDAIFSCAAPHGYQVLGSADIKVAGSDDVAATASCRTLATRLTGMPDLTAAGRLRLVVHILRSDSDGNPVPKGRPTGAGGGGNVSCGIETVGTARLTGTLLALGARAVPFER